MYTEGYRLYTHGKYYIIRRAYVILLSVYYANEALFPLIITMTLWGHMPSQGSPLVRKGKGVACYEQEHNTWPKWNASNRYVVLPQQPYMYSIANKKQDKRDITSLLHHCLYLFKHSISCVEGMRALLQVKTVKERYFLVRKWSDRGREDVENGPSLDSLGRDSPNARPMERRSAKHCVSCPGWLATPLHRQPSIWLHVSFLPLPGRSPPVNT